MKKLFAIGVLAALSVCGQDDTPDGTGGSPVPEPATIGLMGAGLAAFGYAAWRKNKKR